MTKLAPGSSLLQTRTSNNQDLDQNDNYHHILHDHHNYHNRNHDHHGRSHSHSPHRHSHRGGSDHQAHDHDNHARVVRRDTGVKTVVTQVVQTVSVIQYVDGSGAVVEVSTIYPDSPARPSSVFQSSHPAPHSSSGSGSGPASGPGSGSGSVPASTPGPPSSIPNTAAPIPPSPPPASGDDTPLPPTSSRTDTLTHSASLSSPSSGTLTSAPSSHSTHSPHFSVPYNSTSRPPFSSSSANHGSSSALDRDSSVSNSDATTHTARPSDTGHSSHGVITTSDATQSDGKSRGSSTTLLHSPDSSHSSASGSLSVSSSPFSSLPSSASASASSNPSGSTSFASTTRSPNTTGSGDGGGGRGHGGGGGTGGSGPLPTNPTSGSGSGDDSGFPVKTVVGSVVGGIAGVALIALLLMLVLKWKKRQGNGLKLVTEGATSRGGISSPAGGEPTSGGGSGGGGDGGSPGGASGVGEESSPTARSMSERSGPFAIPSALAALGNKRASQAKSESDSSAERGFYRVSGRKLTSVLESGGDGYSDPRDSTAASGSLYRESMAGLNDPSGKPLQLGSPMRPESGIMYMRSGPAKTPVREEGPFSDDAAIPPSPETLEPPNRSFVSQAGSRGSGSRFTEDV